VNVGIASNTIHPHVPSSGASILNQRVKKLTGFGLVLKQTKSYLVFSNRNQTKGKPLYFLISKLNQNQTS
jgi:hypothetical protein